MKQVGMRKLKDNNELSSSYNDKYDIHSRYKATAVSGKNTAV